MSYPHWPDCDRTKCTLDDHASSAAETCRARGWPVGAVLEGNEGYDVTRIVVTAIGRDSILASDVSPRAKFEQSWALRWRCWREVTP